MKTKKINKIKQASKDVEIMRNRKIRMLRLKAMKKHIELSKKFGYEKAASKMRGFVSKIKKLGYIPSKFSKEEIIEIKENVSKLLNVKIY